MTVLPVVILCAFSCKQRSSQDRSALRVENALEIPEAETPSVVELVNSQGQTKCTGTFIAANIILTAAHCIHETPLIYLSNDDDFEAMWQIQSKPYKTAVDEGLDLALLVFPEKCALAQSLLAQELESANSQFTMVGYGCSNLGASGHKRRANGNMQVISGHKQESLAMTSFFSENEFQKSVEDIEGALCPGDSGGPAFQADRIIGVASTRGSGPPKESCWGLTTSPFAKRFFEQAFAFIKTQSTENTDLLMVQNHSEGRAARKYARTNTMNDARAARKKARADYQNRNKNNLQRLENDRALKGIQADLKTLRNEVLPRILSLFPQLKERLSNTDSRQPRFAVGPLFSIGHEKIAQTFQSILYSAGDMMVEVIELKVPNALVLSSTYQQSEDKKTSLAQGKEAAIQEFMKSSNINVFIRFEVNVPNGTTNIDLKKYNFQERIIVYSLNTDGALQSAVIKPIEE